VYAESYSAMSALLRDALAEDGFNLAPDDQLSLRLGQALREAGAQFDHVCVLMGDGHCHVQLLGCSPAHIGISSDELHRLCEEITDVFLRPPQFDNSREDGSICLLRTRPAFSVSCHTRSVAAGQAVASWRSIKTSLRRGEPKNAPDCGDSMRCFSDGQDHFFALLCDGMGSGEAAAVTSACSVLLLERMLRAGVGMDTALSLLNRYLLSRTGGMAEISSTVDLLSLNLFTGRARLVKSGAADTLILRNGQIFTISSRTLPLGILSGVDMQVIPFFPQAGDMIVMMSDGIMDTLSSSDVSVFVPENTSDEAPSVAPSSRDNWLCSLLRAVSISADSDEGIRDLLEQILLGARDRGSTDDMTVAILRVTNG
jgi:stage II sporulation protein E